MKKLKIKGTVLIWEDLDGNTYVRVNGKVYMLIDNVIAKLKDIKTTLK